MHTYVGTHVARYYVAQLDSAQDGSYSYHTQISAFKEQERLMNSHFFTDTKSNGNVLCHSP